MIYGPYTAAIAAAGTGTVTPVNTPQDRPFNWIRVHFDAYMQVRWTDIIGFYEEYPGPRVPIQLWVPPATGSGFTVPSGGTMILETQWPRLMCNLIIGANFINDHATVAARGSITVEYGIR